MSVLAHAKAVLPDRVIDDALVVTEHGLITHVGPARPGAVPAEALDVRGALVLPGIVDTHSDGLETELRPRPGAEFEVGFGVSSFEGRVRAAGVTTVFHGVAFESHNRKGRTVERAIRLAAAIRERVESGHAMVDHRVLYRLDARDPAGLAALGTCLSGAVTPPPLVSFEDHTPGQGQYRDSAVYRRWLEGTEGISAEEAQQRVETLVAERDARIGHREVALGRLAEHAALGRARLLAHDPVTAEEIDVALANGVSVAEFPTTMEAAGAARERGLRVVAGAPNILRGGSHSGNVAAAELVAAGLVDGLSSDYLPSAPLAAALLLASRGVVPLPRAVALVTSGPAAVAGLTDRGALVPGRRADLVVVTTDGGWPTVRMTVAAGDQALLAGAGS
ncbi:alpha-D-ribose 1-methylphosphonate 5-triphosphate diphosphatase [Nonomuraea diastatica]|uniref:Alpha-D-ribose 1-methylphosphonate 5-triphosphate diphosphatase n=1 Tax=Nonomuraea diastatica TaxID=1848329 RepID=A0A4R4W3R3_9ACTN|nr:alpha-D-ribose 1-methylphosphonate 5-triphosphate diphosphatase [Nonomuraea diastatica]TDD13188.1 alpha-D-ribose 1-methylphosphonate 5-triphosphate diphosphatase [Nonomuraea diastatica]